MGRFWVWLRWKIRKKFKCPDCRGTEFLAGPEGGMCINFACANCWSRFNDRACFGIDQEGKVGERSHNQFGGRWVPRSTDLNPLRKESE